MSANHDHDNEGQQDRTERKITDSYTIEPSLLEQFKAAVATVGENKSEVIRLLIWNFLNG
jgi:hypothetical protein